MTTRATAVPVSTLRRFPALASELDRQTALSARVLFVHDDLVVRTGSSRSSAEVFQDSSGSWSAFCIGGFQVAAPAERHTPHEWNQNFHWHPVTGPSRILTEEHRRQYNEDGYCVLPGVVPDETIQRLVSEVDRLERVGEARLRRMQEGKAFIARADEITFTTHIVR